MTGLFCHHHTVAITDNKLATKNNTVAKICYNNAMNNYILITLPEIAKKYDIKTINVAYEPKHQDATPTQTTQNGQPYYTLPICLDVLIKNKIWLAYDTQTKLITYSKSLIGVGNFWLTTLQDDNKNNRIDINQYLINYDR